MTSEPAGYYYRAQWMTRQSGDGGGFFGPKLCDANNLGDAAWGPGIILSLRYDIAFLGGLTPVSTPGSTSITIQVLFQADVPGIGGVSPFLSATYERVVVGRVECTLRGGGPFNSYAIPWLSSTDAVCSPGSPADDALITAPY